MFVIDVERNLGAIVYKVYKMCTQIRCSKQLTYIFFTFISRNTIPSIVLGRNVVSKKGNASTSKTPLPLPIHLSQPLRQSGE